MTVFEKYRMLEEKIEGERSLIESFEALTKEGYTSDVSATELMKHGNQLSRLRREWLALSIDLSKASNMNLYDAKFVLPDYLKSQLGEDYRFAIHSIDEKNYYVLQKEDYVIDNLCDLWEMQGADPESIVILHRTDDATVEEDWSTLLITDYKGELRFKIADYNPVSTVGNVLDNFIRAYIEAKCKDKALTMEKFMWTSEYALTPEEEARELEAEEYFATRRGKGSSRRRNEYYARCQKAAVTQLKALAKLNAIPTKYLKKDQKAHIKALTLSKTTKIDNAAWQIDATAYRKNV